MAQKEEIEPLGEYNSVGLEIEDSRDSVKWDEIIFSLATNEMGKLRWSCGVLGDEFSSFSSKTPAWDDLVEKKTSKAEIIALAMWCAVDKTHT